MMRASVLFILWAALFFSCESNEEFSLDIPTAREAYMVECYLIPDEPIRLSFYRSNPLTEKVALELVWNAEAKVYNGNIEYPLRNILNIDKKGYLYNYVSEDTLRTDDAFNLSILTKEGDSIYAKTDAVSSVKITSATLTERSLLTLNVFQNSLKEEQYFMVRTETILPDTVAHERYHFRFSRPETNNMEIQIKDDFGDAEHVAVYLFSITRENYEFQVSVDQAKEANENIFNIPVSIKSNLNNSAGIFTYCTIDKVEIDLNKNP